MATTRFRKPAPRQQILLDQVRVRPLDPESPAERERYRALMEKHHYLKSDSMVGEQIRYVAEAAGQWVALLGWSAAANHLADREQWIGWSIPQRRGRLALVANNARFLLLPGIDCPNLASRVLALCGARLAGDWQEAYGHPVLVAESFVDSQLFRGTCYKAQGWELLGQTKGCSRSRQDYYTAHGRPKQLWVRELAPGARAVLSAGSLPAELQHIEDAVIPRCGATCGELRDLRALCRRIPDWRAKKGRDYPLSCLLAIMVMASLSGIVRGQRDLAAFASKITRRQLAALGSYRKPDGTWDYPKETTFQRVLANLDAGAFERVLLDWQLRKADADAGEDDQIAIDGKAQRGSTPHVEDEQKAQLVSARAQTSGLVLGTVSVESKSNEIPAVRALLEKLGPLDGKLLMLDALHCCQQTLRQAYQDNGADFLIPVKGNNPELEERANAYLPDRQPAVIPPSGGRGRMIVPPVPCVTAASEDRKNRSRHELRSLRWVAADAEKLCCAHARSVVEITRQTTALAGKNKGTTSIEKVVYVCSLDLDPARGDELLRRIRDSWDIESGMHQRLDVSAAEDASRVRNRNAILVLGILRRCADGLYHQWRRKRKNRRQLTLKDFHDDMGRFNQRLAFATIKS